jgi:hypothetical protein
METWIIFTLHLTTESLKNNNTITDALIVNGQQRESSYNTVARIYMSDSTRFKDHHFFV